MGWEEDERVRFFSFWFLVFGLEVFCGLPEPSGERGEGRGGGIERFVVRRYFFELVRARRALVWGTDLTSFLPLFPSVPRLIIIIIIISLSVPAPAQSPTG